MGEELNTKIDRYEKALTAIEDEAMKIITENMSEQALKGLTLIVSMARYRVDVRE
jgi:hypothetical protein